MHFKGPDIKEIFPKSSFNTSVLKLLLESLERHANKVAQIEVSTGKSYTFADILQHSKSIAAGLSRAGIQPGDYVVICCEKSSLAYSAQLGVMFTGSIAVVINVNFSSDIHKFTRNHVVKAIFCDKCNLQAVKDSVACMNTAPTLIATTDFDDPAMKLLLKPTNEFSLFEVKDVMKTVILVLFSSGSTNDPKGIQISDLSLTHLGHQLSLEKPPESYMLTAPFSWVSNTRALISSIFQGYSLVLNNIENHASHLKLVEKFKVNCWAMNGVEINLYIKESLNAHINLSSLQVLSITGGFVRRTTLDTFESEVLKGTTCNLRLVYGMTETGCISCLRKIDLRETSKANTSGSLLPGVEVKVTDDKGRLAEAGNIGELWVKTLSLMVGYWDCHELNQKVFDSEGFFRTGDAGYFDSDGCLYVVGRASDVITCEGSKISLAEIEDLLKSHPSVLHAGIVAKPNPPEAHNVFAFIVEKPGCHIQEKEISAIVAEHAGDVMKLKAVHKVEAIPSTYSGKVNKRQLLAMVDKLHATSHS